MPDFEVTDLEPADHPRSGDEAPDFTRPLVNADYWEDASLTDVAIERTVLVFVPMVGSFPAQYVFDEIRERGWADREDATVVGVTVSTPYDLARYLREREYPFDLFSDPGNEVARSYGIEHDLDGMAGLEEPRPAVFVLDGDLTVEAAWVADEWPAFPAYDDLEAALK